MKSKPYFYSLILFFFLILSLFLIQYKLNFSRVYAKGILSISSVLIPKQIVDPKQITEFNLQNLFFETLVDKTLGMELVRDSIDNSNACKNLKKRLSFLGNSFTIKYEFIYSNIFESEKQKMEKVGFCQKNIVSLAKNSLDRLFESKSKILVPKNEINKFVKFSNENEKRSFMMFYDLLKNKITDFSVVQYEEKYEVSKPSHFKIISLILALSFAISLSVFFVINKN